MCEGASKQTPDLKILPRRDRAPRFEIPGSATATYNMYKHMAENRSMDDFSQ